jgi:glutaredoxin 3
MGIIKDLSKAALSKTARAALERGGRRAKALSGEALDTLDQLGGRARDSAKAYWQQAAPWRERVAAELSERFGSSEQGDGDNANTESQRSAHEARDNEPAQRQSVGNPDIPVQVFIRNTCPSCHRAQRLLEDAGIEAAVVAIDEEVNAYLARELLVETERATVPYVFIRGEYIGGYDELDQLHRLGELESRLMAPPSSRG